MRTLESPSPARAGASACRRWAHALLALYGAAPLAFAQDTAPAADTDVPATIPVDIDGPAPLPAADEAPVALEEVVVTAQKRRQSLQDVPVSVSAVDGRFIEETGARDLAAVTLYVPNARVDADDLGSPQLFIRGFGTNAFNPSFESSVGFVQDEIYYGRPGYFTESMFDIDRVEVLRGPQGTLFGKNTIAGVYNVTTRGPTAVPEASLSYRYGSDQAQLVEGAAGGMISDRFGARIAGYYRHEAGELYNTYTGRDEQRLQQKAARARLRFLPTESVTTELLYQTSTTSAPFWPLQLYRLDDNTRAYLQGFDPGIEDDPYDFRTEYDTRGYIDKGSQTLGLRNQWDIGDLGGLRDVQNVLVLAGSRFHIDQLNELDVSPADIARLDNHEDHEQRSAELRLSARSAAPFGFGDGMEFLAGAFYYHSTYQLRASIDAGADLVSYLTTQDFRQLAGLSSTDGGELAGLGSPQLGVVTSPLIGPDRFAFDYYQRQRSLGLFGQATWKLGEHWSLTPGLRVNRERKTVTARGQQQCMIHDLTGLDCVTAQLLKANDYPTADQPAQPLQRDETDISPRLVLQYFSGSGINAYASYARGYKSGGYNALSYTGEQLAFKPENAQTYELGARTTFFDRTLRLNATLFLTEFSNLQVLAVQGVITTVSNAARATSRGLESDFVWITPYPPLRLNGSLGLLDATYDRYPNAPAPVRNPDTGELQINATQDLGGERVAFAPRATATLTPTLTYEWQGLVTTFAADAIYQGDQYTDVDLDPATHVGAYTLYAARVIVSEAQERWALTIGGSNLTDKRVLNQVTDASFFPGSYYAQQAPGASCSRRSPSGSEAKRGRGGVRAPARTSGPVRRALCYRPGLRLPSLPMSANDPIVIVSAARTPLGAFQGAFKDVAATDLGATAIRAALARAGLAGDAVSEVFMGCVLTSGLGQAPARQAAIKAGLALSTPCTTVGKVCGSGMKAVMLAHDAIAAGSADIVVAGGMESMSNAPYLLTRGRGGYRMGHAPIYDSMMLDGLEDAYDAGRSMGTFGEDCAARYGFTREAQDGFAQASVQRAQAAIASGAFDAEIAAVTVRDRSGETVVAVDEGPGRVRLDRIATLKPAFRKDGTITAATSSSINDGAAALVLMRESRATALGLAPLARVRGHSMHAQEPGWFTTAPVGAMHKLLARLGWSAAEVDLYEINEAFAVVPMAAMHDLGLAHDQVNVNGGACALGHPIGASGARVLVTLLYALQARGQRRGLASLCIGGGEATALAIELP